MSRLKFRDDAYYAPTSDGICILTNSGEVSLKGASIFEWVDRLAPHLNGRHTLTELTASMAAGRKEMTERVVNALRAEGVVVDLDDGAEAVSHHDKAFFLAGQGDLFNAVVSAVASAGVRMSNVVGDSDFLVYAGDDPEQASALEQQCVEAGIAFVAAIWIGAEVWFGPFGPATDDWPSWSGAWRRLGESAIQRVLPQSATALEVVANQLIHQLVNLDTTARPHLSHFDLVSLHTTHHHYLPHPFSLAAQRTTSVADVDVDDFSRRVTACLDDRLGVLSAVTEGNVPQIPLAISQVRVSDPLGVLRQADPPTVTGAGPTLDDARRAAVLRGLAVYGSLFVDPRRVTSGTVTGQRLADGQAQQIEVGQAFPASAAATSDYAPPPGLAAGFTRANAVRVGLLGQCRQLTLDEISRHVGTFALIECNDPAMAAVGRSLEVYDVTGSLGAPTLAFCLDGVTVAYATALSFPDAWRDGLAQALLAYQAEGAFAWRPVPQLPPQFRAQSKSSCPEWTVDLTTLVERLARMGRVAVAVPLDHDPAVAEIMPHLLNIVLADA